MGQRSLIVVTIDLLLLAASIIPRGTASASAPPVMKVMTRNLYLGADLVPVLLSPTTSNVEAAFATVVTTDFPARAVELANEIATEQPHLIGLQEVVLWRSQTPGDILLGGTTPNASTVVYDFLQILLNELANKGMTYTTVASVTNFDVELAGIGRDIRLTDRDILLARAGLMSPALVLSNAQTGNYTAAGIISFPIGPVTIKRGWVSADASLNGTAFRFINTHLEAFSSFFPGVQEAQAAELLAGPANTSMPVVLAGDFNSAAAGTGFATPTYGNIIAAGFTDAWSVANPSESGFTYGQLQTLSNSISLLFARIDLIFFKGDLQVIGATRVGYTPLSITTSVKWPSDHAGVIVTIQSIPPSVPIPGLSWPGLLVMAGLLVGATLWVTHRRSKVKLFMRHPN